MARDDMEMYAKAFYYAGFGRSHCIVWTLIKESTKCMKGFKKKRSIISLFHN